MGPDGVRISVRVEAEAGMKPHIWACHVIWALVMGFEKLLMIGGIYAKSSIILYAEISNLA